MLVLVCVESRAPDVKEQSQKKKCKQVKQAQRTEAADEI